MSTTFLDRPSELTFTYEVLTEASFKEEKIKKSIYRNAGSAVFLLSSLIYSSGAHADVVSIKDPKIQSTENQIIDYNPYIVINLDEYISKDNQETSLIDLKEEVGLTMREENKTDFVLAPNWNYVPKPKRFVQLPDIVLGKKEVEYKNLIDEPAFIQPEFDYKPTPRRSIQL